jgi:hypothetical protein
MRRELWLNAVRVIQAKQGSMMPEHGPPAPRVPKPHLTDVTRKRASLDVPLKVKAPFATTVSMGSRPVVHLTLDTGYCRWERPRIKGASYWHESDMTKPLSEWSMHVLRLCHPNYSTPVVLWMEHPTYDNAWPGKWEDGEELMPFCRSCVRLRLDDAIRHNAMVVWKGDVW